MNTALQCKAVRNKTEAKIEEIEEKILSLQRIKAALQRLVGSCRINKSLGECPILEAVDAEGFNTLWDKKQR